MRRTHLPLVALTSLFAAGCDGGADAGATQVRDDVFVWSGLGAAGATLSVHDFAGDIEVRPSADDTVRVRARLEWRGAGDPGNDVHFTGANVGTGRDVLVCAILGDGRCTVDNYTANVKRRRNLNVKAHFMIEAPAGMRIVAQNLSGDVTVAASAPVEARTLSGDIRVATAVGPVRGETLNGDVDLRMASLAPGTDSILGKSLNGDVYIYLRELQDVDVDLGVMNGGVSSTFQLTNAVVDRKSLKVRVGTGARVLHGYVLNGSVALRQLDAEGKAP